MKILDATFGHPRGLLGRLGGMIMARSTIQRNALTIRLLTIHPDDHILDMGCGPGALIHALAEHTPDGLVVGIDTSPVMLQQATRRNAQLIQQGKVQLQRASALVLPFADAMFDGAALARSAGRRHRNALCAQTWWADRPSFCSLSGSRPMTRSRRWVINYSNCSQALVSVRPRVRSSK